MRLVSRYMRNRTLNYIYKKLKLPYLLHVASDSGTGQPVIFLHGIASNSSTWNKVLPLVSDMPIRAITIDLLGFGLSPAPEWPEYTLQDHAKSVARTIRKLKLKQTPIIVGHSMGSLIAVELASSYTKHVKQLILCSIPLYVDGDFDDSVNAYKAKGKKLNNAYFSVYERLIANKDFTLKSAQKLDSISKNEELELNAKNWNSFTMSLKNAIIKQNTIQQLEVLAKPVWILFGKLDVLLLTKYYVALASTNKNIKVASVIAGHGITDRYAALVAKTISSQLDYK